MKNFKVFLVWLVLLLVLALVSWGTVLYLAWPLWTAAALFLAALGAYFLAKALRRIFIVMRSRSKMTHPSEASRASMAKIASPEALLTRKWKEAVATLRNSSLKRMGNPLYVLPWYMVIGRSGTGKTTALARARLASPIQKISQRARIEETLNCDWWYFDKAIVIDCAGRYVDAETQEADRREWELNLDLLAKYRSREGLNGLVIAVAADRLLDPDPDLLVDEGRVIRERIEQLIRLFGKRFPIYVLVTKCDRLYGMESWAQELPENMLEQAMGYLAEEHEGDKKEAEFLEAAFASIGERLRKLRLALVARSPDVSPDLLLFPNELEHLKPVLLAFLRNCVGNNPYLESPFLRGLFFSSGLQHGGAVSALLRDALPALPSHPERNSGLFLHDFFGRILPQDRRIARPAMLVNHWYRVTHNLGLASWLLFTAAAGTLMTVSFFNNLDTLSQIRDTYPFAATYTGRMEDDVATLETASDALIRIENSNRHWKTGWMVASTNMDDLEDRLKQNFVTHYRKYLQTEKNFELADDIPRFLQHDPDNHLPQLVINQVRRINMLQARLEGASRDQLAAMPQPAHAFRYTPEIFDRFSMLYISHLAWSEPSDAYLQRMQTHDRAMVDRVEETVVPSFSWMVGLLEKSPSVTAVTPAIFWKGAADRTANEQYTTVAAAYTAAGRKEIDSLLNEVEKSTDDGPKFVQRKAAFEAWYRDRRQEAWQHFIADFPSAEKTLRGEIEWRAALGTITGVQSPYYRVIDRLNDEFKDVPEQSLPEWLQFARHFARLREQARVAPVADEALKVIGSVNAVGGEAIRRTSNGNVQEGGQVIRNNLTAISALRKFLGSVDKVAAEVADGPAKAYQVAADFHTFSRDQNVKASAVHSAADALLELKRLINRNHADDEAIWHLIEGPFKFTLAYTQQQASCQLQQEWDAKVQWPLQTATSMTEIVDQLYGQSGTVWAFADGPAKPFLARDASRFRIVETFGFAVPLTANFLPMLNNAAGKRVEQLVMQQKLENAKRKEELQAQKEQLEAQAAIAEADRVLAEVKQKSDALKAQTLLLTITGQPISVNPGAKSKPFGTTLNVQCNAGAHTLNNFNFPTTDSFSWSAETCGEVALQIKAEDLVLSKKYPGALGLIRFLQDFRDGQRQFHADEFPSSATKLRELGISQIGLRYKFEGQEAVLKVAQQLEQLALREKEAKATKQRVQDAQNAKAQQHIEVKLAGSNEPPMQVSLPNRIGTCWDSASKPYKQQKPQTTESMFKELVEKELSKSDS